MEKLYSGKSLDALKNEAVADFAKEGISEFDIDFEILEQPVKKLFGFKGEYRVRAVHAAGDITSIEDILSDTDMVAREPKGGGSDLFDTSKYDKYEALTRKHDKDEYADTEKNQRSVTAGVRTYVPESPSAVSKAPTTEFPKERVTEYLRMLMNGVGAGGFTIDLEQNGGQVNIFLRGDKLGGVIGHHGETLDSIQYLTFLAKNQFGGGEYRINIDAGGYRSKRRDSLEELAKRTAAKVAKTGRRVTLEPMPSYERRIIHGIVSRISGVNSASTGSEPYRKVIISAGGGGNNRVGGGFRRTDNRPDRGTGTDFVKRQNNGGERRGAVPTRTAVRVKPAELSEQKSDV